MAVNAIDLLTTLTRTGLVADTATAAGTGATSGTDDFALLFQTALANAVTQATVQATAVVATDVPVPDAATLEQNPSDVLNSLLNLLDQADDQDPTDDSAAVTADTLSQLLANLGVNLPPLAASLQTQPPAAPADSTPTTPLGSPVFTALENANPLAPPAGQSLVPSAAGPTTPPAASPAAVAPPRPAVSADPLAAPRGLPSPAESVAGANRVAGRNPAVVVQVPVVTDLNQQLPNAVDPSGRPVAPAVNEPTPVQGVPPVNPGVSATVAQDASPTAELITGAPPALIARPPVSTPPTQPPAAPFTVELARTATPPAAVAPAVTPATGPVAPRAAVGSTEPPSVPTVTAAAVPAVPQANPVAAPVPPTPVRPANPEVAVTVAQPVALPVGSLEVVKFGGVSVAGAIPTPSELPLPSSDGGTPMPFVPVSVGGSAAVATAPVELPSAATPPPVAGQLAGPILAQVRDRPAAGETEIQVRLDPPELGTVKLKIVSTGGEVRAELHVSSEAVRQVVQSQLPDLQQRLDDAGVRVQRFDVTADSQGGPARDDRGETWRGPPPVELPPPPVRPRRPAVAADASGRIDVTA